MSDIMKEYTVTTGSWIPVAYFSNHEWRRTGYGVNLILNVTEEEIEFLKGDYPEWVFTEEEVDVMSIKTR